jgi:F-type H+-transporting ATPase subunit b
MEILPDPWMLLLQAIPFALTIFVLNTVLFKPMVSYLDDRDTAIHGSRKDAKELQKKADEKVVEYETALASAKNEASIVRADSRKAALAARENKLEVARAAVDAEISAALEEVAAAKAAAAHKLEDLSAALAAEITAKVLASSSSNQTV